jgi:hypothetical protein
VTCDNPGQAWVRLMQVFTVGRGNRGRRGEDRRKSRRIHRVR